MPIPQILQKNPKIRKGVGWFLIIVGLAALLTPFTPGSWLIFVGFELLGLRVLFPNKVSRF